METPTKTTNEQIHQEVVTLGAKVDALRNVNNRVVVFVDNTNLNFTTRKVEACGAYRLCYEKLVNFLVGDRQLRQVRIYYSDYSRTSTLSPEESARRSERDGFYGWLRHQGFWLKECSLVERTDGTTKEKGLDAAIIKDMERLCWQGVADTIILVAGDLDYMEMVQEVQSFHNTPIEVAFFPEYAAKKLQYAATKFINLTEAKEVLRRK